MIPVYRPILKIAWQILWRAKYLWFFGLFAVLISGGEVNLMINNYSKVSEGLVSLETWRQWYLQGLIGNFGSNFAEFFSGVNALSWLLLVVLVMLFVVIWALAVIGQAGLVGGAYREYRKQQFGFVEAWRAGKNNFWPVLWLNVLGKIIIWAIMLVLGLPLAWLYLTQGSSWMQFLYVILSFVILIPIALIVSFLIKYAVIYAVLKKQKVGEAFRNGWQLFKKNWLVSIEMMILMFFVGILAGLSLLVASILLVLPVALLLSFLSAMQIQGFVLAATVLVLTVMIVLLFIIAAMLATYQTTCWVLLFDKLTESQVYAKVARWAGGLFNKDKVKVAEE